MPAMSPERAEERRKERCSHGILWPWQCHECDELAWAEAKRESAKAARSVMRDPFAGQEVPDHGFDRDDEEDE